MIHTESISPHLPKTFCTVLCIHIYNPVVLWFEDLIMSWVCWVQLADFPEQIRSNGKKHVLISDTPVVAGLRILNPTVSSHFLNYKEKLFMLWKMGPVIWMCRARKARGLKKDVGVDHVNESGSRECVTASVISSFAGPLKAQWTKYYSTVSSGWHRRV